MIFHASAMNRIVRCPASVRLIAKAPKLKKDRSDADFGIDAHKVSASILKDKWIPTCDSIEIQNTIGEYVKFCQDIMKKTSNYWIEDALSMTLLDSAAEKEIKLNGTPDFAALVDGTLHVVDLKIGYAWVEPYENYQLLSYAALLIAKDNFKFDKIKVTIVQPRANHPEGTIRSDTLGRNEFGYETWRIQDALFKAAGKYSKTTTGPQCAYCDGIPICRANQMATHAAFEVSCSELESQLNGAFLSRELEMMTEASRLIKYRGIAVEALAKQHLREGKEVPGYQLVPTKTARKWIVKDPISAGKELGVDLAKPAAAITPTQAKNSGILSGFFVKVLSKREEGPEKLKKIDINSIKEKIKNAD